MQFSKHRKTTCYTCYLAIEIFFGDFLNCTCYLLFIMFILFLKEFDLQ